MNALSSNLYPAPRSSGLPWVSLHGVSKAYPLSQHGTHRLRNVWRMWRRSPPEPAYHALQNIDLQVFPGESVGVIGVNGAGKSTLLKVVAGVVTPGIGRVERRGRLAALLELGAGFHPEFTGWQNVQMACAIMGLNPQETAEQMARIVEFADIGDHVQQPVKHYSSGMVVRLGFAVATCIRPDLLITDEILAVGDESFQRKCIAWIEEYLADGGTLLLCSHSMYHVQKLCQRALWIHQGRVRMAGCADEVARAYLDWHTSQHPSPRAQRSATPPAVKDANLYHVADWRINGQEDLTSLSVHPQASLLFEGTVYTPDGRRPHLAVGVALSNGEPLYGFSSDMDGYTLQPTTDPNHFVWRLTFDALPLLPARYILRVHAMDPEALRAFDHVEIQLQVEGRSRAMGSVQLPHHWG